MADIIHLPPLPLPSPGAPSLRFSAAQRRAFSPRSRLSVSECAARYRIVTEGDHKGPWTNTLTPFAVEPMDRWSDRITQEIIFCAAPQTVKTQIAFNCVLSSVGQDPDPLMYVMPTEKKARRLARRRLLPALRASSLTAPLISRHADDVTSDSIICTGMEIIMAWAGSATSLSSDPVRYLIFDEVDKYDEYAEKEADPLSLGEQRTNSYPYTKKILYISSPGLEGGAMDRLMRQRADVIYDRTAICPICGREQVMRFLPGQSFTWPADITDPRVIRRRRLAWYVCEKCGMKWDDRLRDQAVCDPRGRWLAREPVERPLVVAYHLPAWYSAGRMPLSRVVAAHLVRLADPSKDMAFVTQYMAEPYSLRIAPKKELETLRRVRSAVPPCVVPARALALTAGVDSHKDYFKYVVRAWAANLDNWLVDYGILPTLDDVEALVLQTTYAKEESDIRMGIWRAAIDTGGGKGREQEKSLTVEICEWLLKQKMHGRIFGTKGASHPQLKRVHLSLVGEAPKMRSGRRPKWAHLGTLQLRLLDTDSFKQIIHGRIERDEGESQRFLVHAETNEDYINEVLAEEVHRDRRGNTFWVKIRSANHYLDCEVGAAACVDPEWLPSFAMLAPGLEQQRLSRAASSPQPTAAPSGRRVVSAGVR
jgi:phage terminase large subunit GpA-like protein